MTITWQQPSNVGGDNVEITYYKIEILLKNGAFESVCDGYDATLILTRTCKVSMETFLKAPFNFVQGDSIKARVTASNSLGEGTESFVSHMVVAEVETIPHAPSTKVYVD